MDIRTKGIYVKQYALIVCILVAILAFPQKALAAKEAESGQRSGFLATFAIGSEYMTYRAQGDGFNGVFTTFNTSLGWIFRDYAKIEMYGSIGFAPVETVGKYPLQADVLSSLNFTRGLAAMLVLGGKGGFNFASIGRHWRSSLYLNTGSETFSNVNSFLGSPYYVALFLTSYFIELEGRTKVDPKWAIEYLVRASAGAGTFSYIPQDIIQSPDDLIAPTSGYGFKGSVGAQYKLGTRAYFFTRFVATYWHINQAEATILTTKANPSVPTTFPNTSISLAYPATNIMYAGLQFGFGF